MDKVFERAILNSNYINELLAMEVSTEETPNRTVIKLLNGTSISISEYVTAKGVKPGFKLKTNRILGKGDDLYDLAPCMDSLVYSADATIESITLSTAKKTVTLNIIPITK